MTRASVRWRRGVAAGTALLAVIATALAVVPPQSSRSLTAAASAVTVQAAPGWLVVVAVLWFADRLLGPAPLDAAAVRRVTAVVFAGVLLVELTPLAGAVESRVLGEVVREHVVGALRAALYPAGTVAGVGFGAMTIRGTVGADADGLPLAGAVGFARERAPAAVWRVARCLAIAAALSVGVAVLTTLTVAPAPYFALAVVEAVVAAGAGFADSLPVGIALLALLVVGVNRRHLLAATVGVWAVTFLLGIGVGILARLLGVAAVSLTVTPIPAVESANLVSWPAPLSWDLLTATGSVLAAGVGLWVIQGNLGAETRRDVGAGPSERGSDR